MFLRISTTSTSCKSSFDAQAAAMTIFLGPFGFLAAVVAVVLESWLFVKIFVGSFLIKGMIGEDVFEAVSPHTTHITSGPPTTLQRINPKH